MPTTLQAPVQTLVKNSYASAPNLDLTLVCNGEEKTRIFTHFGDLVIAGIEAPTVAPLVNDSSAGNLTNGRYVCYVYVYAATQRYPNVQDTIAAGGDISPRSNPSPRSAAYQITGAGNRKLGITVTKTTRSDISKIWVYRTGYFATAALAETNADAGILFYVGAIINDGNAGTAIFLDNEALANGEQVEYDNFLAPTAAYCVYYNPYFYLFGNNILKVGVVVSYSSTGPVTTITLNDPAVSAWFDGRNLQSIKLDGISVGGYDGFGTFYFKYLTPTTAQLVTDYVGTNGYTNQIGNTYATIYGFSTTLYRSKANNPFAWGRTKTLGGLSIPQLYTLQVGGGIGTGLAVIPNNALLKLDVENPNKAYLLNLKLQEDDNFASTLRILSENYTVSLQNTQFATISKNQTAVLWALDFKNYSIIETDGNSQIPVSDAVFKFLRSLASTEAEQKYFHGIFDPYTECNFFWVKENFTQPKITHCIYQHVPTGQWGLSLDFDITASCILQDAVTNESLVLGGTDTGMVGRILKPDKFNNWLASGRTFQVSQIGSTPNAVAIKRETNITQAEHLTSFKFYFFNNITVQKSVWAYYDVGSTGAPPPSGSVGFDYIVSIGIPLGTTPAAAITIIAAAMVPVGTTSDLFTVTTEPGEPTKFFLFGLYGINSVPTNAANVDSNTIVHNYYRGSQVVYETDIYGLQPLTSASHVEGTWALVEVDRNGLTHSWVRIREVFGNFLFYDLFYLIINELSSNVISIMDRHCSIYFGLIECIIQKSFDLNAITKRKGLREIWVAATNQSLRKTSADDEGEIEYFYRDKFLICYNKQLNIDPFVGLIPSQDKDAADALIGMFFITAKDIPSNPFKQFGFTIIQRGFTAHTIYNLALKMNV